MKCADPLEALRQEAERYANGEYIENDMDRAVSRIVARVLCEIADRAILTIEANPKVVPDGKVQVCNEQEA